MPATPDTALTPTQASLEKKYSKTIKEILEMEFEKHKYQKNMTMRVAFRLDIGLQTLKAWCRQFNVSPRNYRYAPGTEQFQDSPAS